MKVLFVCTANRGRSAMAACYFQQLCQQNELTEVEVSSAGLAAREGMPASNFSIDVMEELGLDLKQHLATQLTQERVDEADLVITMGDNHQAFIEKEYSADSTDVRKLLSFLGKDENVEDPTEEDPETFAKCFLTMMPALAQLADRIIRSK